MTIRKVKSMAEILKEFPDIGFDNSGNMHVVGVSTFIKAEQFCYLGNEIELKPSRCGRLVDEHDNYWVEDWLHPLPKKKEIKLYRYFFKKEDDSIESTEYTSKLWTHVYAWNLMEEKFILLKTEEKTIEVDDNEDLA